MFELVQPISPPVSDQQDLVEAYSQGNKNFAILFSRWMDGNDWSHPVVVSLAKGACGGASWFHSSQISGIRQGKSQSPGPRQFIAIERLNRALYNYRNGGSLIPGTDSSNHYSEAQPILTDEGECPDLGWFVGLFSGVVDLPAKYKGPNTVFSKQAATDFSRKYARLIRKLFVLKDLDLIENLDLTLLQHYPARDKDRLTKIKNVLTSPAVWSPDELAIELVALIALSKALDGPADEHQLFEELR